MKRLAFHLSSTSFPLLVVTTLLACGSAATLPDMSSTGNDLSMRAGDYPAGPYGTGQGSVIDDLVLSGRREANGDGITDGKDPMVMIRLRDYYANKKVKALFVDVSAEWCGPCKAAQPALKALFADYTAKGGKVAFLEGVVQNNAKQPADLGVIDRWATAYKLPFDMTPDPDRVLGPYYNENAFPTEFVIRTRDMSIVWLKNGAMVEEAKAQIDAVLAQ